MHGGRWNGEARQHPRWAPSHHPSIALSSGKTVAAVAVCRWTFIASNTTAMCRGFPESAASCFPRQHYFMTEPDTECEPNASAVAPNTMRKIQNSGLRRKTLSAIGIGSTVWVGPERIKLEPENLLFISISNVSIKGYHFLKYIGIMCNFSIVFQHIGCLFTNS